MSRFNFESGLTKCIKSFRRERLKDGVMVSVPSYPRTVIPKFAGSNLIQTVDFKAKKIFSYAFLRRGSKAGCPMLVDLLHVKDLKPKDASEPKERSEIAVSDRRAGLMATDESRHVK